MNVAFITDEYPPTIIGGAGIYAHYLTIEISKYVDITVIRPSNPYHYKVMGIKKIVPENVNIVGVPSIRAPLLWFPSVAWQIRKFLRHESRKFNIIHINSLAGFLIPDLEIPKICTIHHLIIDEISCNRGAGKTFQDWTDTIYDSFLLRKVEQKTIKNADHLISISYNTADSIKKHYGISEEKITVIPPAVDTERFRPRPKSEIRENLGLPLDTTILLLIGRLETRKNVANLIYALKLLKRNNFNLIICGTGPLYHQLRRLATKLELAKKIIFIGSVSDEKLPFYYNAADVYVHPALLEGFGLTLLESMASGTPTVASNATAVGGPIKNGEIPLITCSPTPEEFANKIAELLDDSQLYRKLEKESVEFVRTNYSWKATAEKTLKVYESALASKNR